MKQNIATSIIAIVTSISSMIASEIPAKPQDHPISIVGATIHTVSGHTIENGTILFDKGKITAIGTDVNLPQGTETFDGKGKHVYPGLIDARSNL